MASKKTAEKKQDELFTIYGARESQSGERVNITLVKNDADGNKVFGTVSIKKDGGKVAVKLDAEYCYLKIKRLDIVEEDNDIDSKF